MGNREVYSMSTVDDYTSATFTSDGDGVGGNAEKSSESSLLPNDLDEPLAIVATKKDRSLQPFHARRGPALSNFPSWKFF